MSTVEDHYQDYDEYNEDSDKEDDFSMMVEERYQKYDEYNDDFTLYDAFRSRLVDDTVDEIYDDLIEFDTLSDYDEEDIYYYGVDRFVNFGNISHTENTGYIINHSVGVGLARCTSKSVTP
jgi:hypothetical protein